MDELGFYVTFNNISVMSGRWKGEHERFCAMKRSLGLEETRLQRDSNPRPCCPITNQPRGSFRQIALGRVQ